MSRLDRVEPGDMRQFVARLVREKGVLEQVFDALREGVIVLSPGGVIEFINRAACGFFGLDPLRAVGRRLAAQVRGLDWESVGRPDRAVSCDLEVFYPESRHLNFYLAPLGQAAAGEPQPGFVMLVRDITRTRAEAEETLESERLNALTLLAAGVAHEIGNPLNSLDIHLQLLGRKFRKLPPGDREPLEDNLATARAEIARLDAILKQFLHAVRPTVPRRERTDLNALLREALALLEPEIASRRIVVQLDFAEGMPPAMIDAGQMRQVFYNLLRNAYQAVPPDGGLIAVRTDSNDYEFLISVEDNGGGIAPEMMGSLFEPYRTTKSSGSGLGLLIVRRIVREHGGQISVGSGKTDGTQVVIHLPRTERAARLLAAPDPVIDT